MSESKPIRILCMEDDPGLARLFQKKLERAGYVVDIARDGKEGLAMYAAGAYDVVAVDQAMPVYNGLDVIRILASQGPLPPTIMVTGTGNEKIAVEAMKLGAGDYIVKDVGGGYLDLLPTVIEQVLLRHHLVEEKQRAEEALRESEQRYRRLVESSDDLIFSVGRAGIFRTAGGARLGDFGFRPEDVVGRSLDDLFSPEEAKRYQELHQEVFESGETLTCEHTFEFAGVSQTDLTTIYPIKDERGAVELVGVICRDITERKQAEEALRESEERFRAVFETAQDSIFIKDRTQRYTLANPAMERLFGLPALELIGLTDEDLFGEAAGAHIREVDSRVLDGETIEEEHTKPVEGVPTTFHTVKVPMRDASGEIIGVCGIARDVTERVRAEREIKERQQYLEGVLGAAPDAIVTLDAHHRIVEWNASAERLFGYSREEVIGQDLDDLITGHDVFEQATGLTQRILGGRKVRPLETVRYRKDGSPVDVIVTGAPILVGDELIGVVAVYTDITERVRAEETLEFERAQLLSIFNGIDEIVYVADPDTHEILYVNKSLRDAFQKSLVGGICYRELQGFDSPCEFCTNEIILKEKYKPYQWEYHNPILNRDYAIVDRIIKWPDGRDVRFELAIDITARVRAEEALRESEERLRAFARALPDLAFILDENGRHVEVLTTQEHLLREEAAQMKGRLLHEVLPEEVADLILAMVRRTIETGKPQTLEYELDVPLGRVWFEGRAAPMRGTFGETRMVVLVSRDITERVRAEEALRRERNRAQRYLDIAGVMLVALNEKGEITLMNRRGHRILGYEEGELVGRNWFDTCLPTPIARDVRFVFEQLMAGEIEPAESYENPVSTKSGQERVVAWHNTVLTDEAGAIVGVLSSGEDITARVRAEKALRARERFLSLLNDITLAALETPDLPTMLHTLADRLNELFDADGCYLTLWDEATQTTIPTAAYGEWREAYPSLRSEPGEATMTESVLRAGHPLAVEDVFDTPHLSRRIAELFPTRSLLGLPLMAGRQKLGAALIAFNEPHHFTSDEVARGEQVARQIALAVAKAQVLAAEREQRTLAETLREVTLALTSQTTLSAVLDEILRQAQRIVPYSTANIALLEGEALRVVHWQGYDTFGNGEAIANLIQPLADFPLDAGVVRARKPLVIPDTQQEPRWLVLDEAPWIRSYLSIPICLRDRVLGLLRLDGETPGEFSAGDVQRLQPLVSAAAVAIENARLVGDLEAEVVARMAEIVAEKEKSEAILRSVGDAIAMTNLEMRIRYVNDAFTALTGYAAEEALGQRISSLMGEGMSEQARQSMRLVMSRGEVWQGEVTHRRKDGRTYEAALTAAPMRDADGRLTGYVSSHRDISRRKKLDRARRQFMTNISHELRTPVANIKLYTQLVRKKLRPEKTDHYLQVLVEQSERLENLIQDMLEMADLDSGQAVMVWAPVSLFSVIGDTVTRYQSQAEEAGLTLQAVSIPPDMPAVRGDQARLAQALAELVENAVIFTPAGGQVTVEAETTEARGRRWVTISVQDTGPGISAEEQERVFDRFFRGSLAESGHVPGTGLGLSIAQEIAQAHGGRVTVESETGQGSTFRLWLPLGEG